MRRRVKLICSCGDGMFTHITKKKHLERGHRIIARVLTTEDPMSRGGPR